MKVTSSKTIHVTEKELKEAIGNWLAERTSHEDVYYQHFIHNNSIFEFDKDGNLIIVIDGETEEYNSEKK
jgi:nitrate reductase NapAB chaperone NapD